MWSGQPQKSHYHNRTPKPARTLQVIKLDPEEELKAIFIYLTTLKLPKFETNTIRVRFLRRVQQFYIEHTDLFKRHKQQPQKVIFDWKEREHILEFAHGELGHRGVHATFELIKRRFYWPNIFQYIKHHIQSCHQCQINSVKKVVLPLIPSTPPLLFIKIHVDIMYMPKAGDYRYIVAA